jgi:hypothetical protein
VAEKQSSTMLTTAGFNVHAFCYVHSMCFAHNSSHNLTIIMFSTDNTLLFTGEVINGCVMVLYIPCCCCSIS